MVKLLLALTAITTALASDETLIVNCKTDSSRCKALEQYTSRTKVLDTTSKDILMPVQNRFGLKLRFPVINHYGCWCYAGDSWPGAKDTTGYGPVMDLYDEACKSHHMGFDCIVADAIEEGETCHPTQTKYDLTVSPQPNGDYLLECSNTIEDDWCKAKVCMVDIKFIARQWHLDDMGVPKNYVDYGHPGFHDNIGNFDTDVCATGSNDRNPGPGQGGRPKLPVHRICCGEYPYRIWFDKNNKRNLGCCTFQDEQINEDYGFPLDIGALFNTLTQTCCPSGVENGHEGNVCP